MRLTHRNTTSYLPYFLISLLAVVIFFLVVSTPRSVVPGFNIVIYPYWYIVSIRVLTILIPVSAACILLLWRKARRSIRLFLITWMLTFPAMAFLNHFIYFISPGNVGGDLQKTLVEFQKAFLVPVTVVFIACQIGFAVWFFVKMVKDWRKGRHFALRHIDSGCKIEP